MPLTVALTDLQSGLIRATSNQRRPRRRLVGGRLSARDKSREISINLEKSRPVPSDSETKILSPSECGHVISRSAGHVVHRIAHDHYANDVGNSLHDRTTMTQNSESELRRGAALRYVLACRSVCIEHSSSQLSPER